MSPHLLVVGGGPEEYDSVAEIVAREGLSAERVPSYGDAPSAIGRASPDVVLLMLSRNSSMAGGLVDQVKAEKPGVAVIAAARADASRYAIEVLRMGADEFIRKPLTAENLIPAIRKKLARLRSVSELPLHADWPSPLDERFLGSLFWQAPSALVCLDGANLVSAANRAAARTLGYTPDTLSGLQFGDLVSDRIRARWLAYMRAEASGRKGYEGEIHLKRGTGDWFPASVHARAAETGSCLILCIADLTRQKAIEKHLFESKKLASLGHLVEGVAHEVRNPLLSIGGFARKLRCAFDTDTREHHYLDIIVCETERLERMVKDIEKYLAFARAHHKEFSPISVRSLLLGALPEHPKSGDREHEINLNFAEGPEDIIIYGDFGLLTELFEVLFENSFDAMPKGGRLEISVRADDGTVSVRVADTGKGMDPKSLEEIFDPFFTSKTKGAGLGLAKAYMIAEDHGGSIHFESEVGVGTVCTVTLPVDRRALMRGSPI